MSTQRWVWGQQSVSKLRPLTSIQSANKPEVSPAAFYFGPQTGRAKAASSSPNAFNRGDSAAPAANVNGVTKVEVDPAASDLRSIPAPASKPGLHEAHDESNGFVEGKASAHSRQPESKDVPDRASHTGENGHVLNGMDIDQTPLPAIEPQQITTLMEGLSKAIQSESAKDLTPHSSTLSFADRHSILHAIWNPHPQRSVLAVGGSGLCQLLHFNDGASTSTPTRVDLFPSQEISMVTSMAWNPDGTVLAIAARFDSKESSGNISTWTADGKALDELSAAQDLVLKLRWNPQGSMLLGITATGDDSSSLVAWDMRTGQALPVHCGNVITDAVWTGDNAVTLCGAGALGRWDVWGSQGIWWAQKSNSSITERDWTHVFYERSPDTCHVFAEESAYTASLNGLGVVNNVRRIHEDSITQVGGGSPRPILVTSSLDGDVKVWDSNLQPVLTLQFGQDSPPLTAALNAQSSFLAAANHNKVLVWDSSGRRVPVGTLRVDFGKAAKVSLPNGNNTDRDSGIGDDGTEDGLTEPSLSMDWDPSGTRLALGIANQVCISSPPLSPPLLTGIQVMIVDVVT